MTLPTGFEVRLRPGVRSGQNLLVGGAPLKVLRLSDRARKLLVHDVLRVRDRASALLAERLLEADIAVPVGLTRAAPEDLTVVVPVKDSPDALDRCLSVLRGAEAGLRVIVVDDGSTDPGRHRAVCSRHGVELVTHLANRGPAAARNTGFALVRTELVAFVDADVQVGARDLLDLAGHFEDPVLAIVGPRIVARRTKHPVWHERFEHLASSLDQGARGGLVRAGGTPGFLPSACLVARTNRLGAGFDEGMRVGEDVDLIWRSVRAGQRVRYVAEVLAEHDVRPTSSSWLSRKFVYGTSAAPLAAKNPAELTAAVMTPAVALVSATLLVRSPAAVPAAVAGTVLVWTRLRRVVSDDLVAARLAVVAIRSGVDQEASLLLRHWWPVVLPAAIASRSVRRAVGTAAALDATRCLRRAGDLDAGPVTIFAARRLDDFAYGAGLWVGCLRARSLRALRIRRAI